MKKLISLALLFAANCMSLQTGFAASSDWFETDGARMRLISLPSSDGASIEAGLQLELKDGWKTYWRSPGGSGLPPQVHFLGSKNLVDIDMKLPVPRLFRDETGTSVGYKGDVVFPINAKRLNLNGPVSLSASGVVGICSDICIPVPFNLSLKDKGNSGTQFDIAMALNKGRANLPSKPSDDFRVTSVTFDQKAKLVRVSAKLDESSKQTELFVEGPSSWYLATSKLVKRDGKVAKFSIDVQDAPVGDMIIGRTLTLTLVADGKGIEQVVEIAK